MSEKKICCPRCGQERVNNTGVFCTNCGLRLVDAGGNPGALTGRPVVNVRDRIKNNAYANMTGVGYSTWWQTYGLERKIVTVAVWSLAACAFAGVGCIFTGRILLGFVLFLVGFLGIFVTAGISALRPKNREQIRENGIIYKGNIHYKRNPVTGELEDASRVDVHYLTDSLEDDTP